MHAINTELADGLFEDDDFDIIVNQYQSGDTDGILNRAAIVIAKDLETSKVYGLRAGEKLDGWIAEIERTGRTPNVVVQFVGCRSLV